MSQSLIEINGKYYKEVDVVILKGKERADHKSLLLRKDNSLKSPITGAEARRLEFVGFKPQHMYFLSNEEIKEADWCINDLNAVVKVTYKNGASVNNVKKHCKKIIATTDSSLSPRIHKGEIVDDSYPKEFRDLILPQPSPEFKKAYAEAYNRGEPITKVLVEYEVKSKVSIGTELSGYRYNSGDTIETLKLKDNQIIIKKVEEKTYTQSQVDYILDQQAAKTTAQILENQKRMYSESEVVNLIENYDREFKLDTFAYTKPCSFTVKDWIKQNLHK